MSTKLNAKTLMIAAVVLVILALLVMATPLVSTTGAANRGSFTGNGTFNGRAFATPQGGFTGQGFTGQTFNGGTSGTTGGTTGGTGTTTTRGFTGANRPTTLLRIGFLSGVEGTMVYAGLLLISLAAALGMFLTKAWGKILGILMGAVYAALALVSTLPLLFSGFLSRAIGGMALSIGFNVLHLVLALVVIVLALIPAKKLLTPVAPVAPTTPVNPPTAVG
jgi:hypothetical protein